MTESRGVRVIKGATEDLGRKQRVISTSLREITANLRCYARLRLSSVLLVLAVGLFSCTGGGKTDGHTLFTLLSPARTGVTFANQLHYTEELNMYTFRNFYNGGGVGVGSGR